ncbi:dienelactone hydrolase family protein [Devosia sp. ZB163]|uniref:dienelactone hydrolase family protein n=1 Tax=Devosia sp. ZB163 TaxID=3025938 RepID=UPI0023608B8E|nr:dienelactone hydrolase family protein [Devosia sp. ZB163]MDC9823431.1 dienelactone hydrolase family protein [Devosia sp. ZB163]
MGERFKLTASDGFVLNAYRARPEGKVRGGVVLIQEVWGLSNWIRSVADRWAHHGYLTIAPAMFDRVDYGYESNDYTPEQFQVIGALMKQFSMDTAMLDVEAAIQSAAEGGKVGITGYCFGGRISWIAASNLSGLSAASGYYGGGVPNYIDLTPRVPTEMHFGDKDQGIPLDQVEQLKSRHPEADIYVYNGDHGFCNSDRPDKFDEASCTKASARSLEFFHKHLG